MEREGRSKRNKKTNLWTKDSARSGPSSPAATTWSRNTPPRRALPKLLTHRIGNETIWLMWAMNLSDTGRPALIELRALHCTPQLCTFYKLRLSTSTKLPIHCVATLALLHSLEPNHYLRGMLVVGDTIIETQHTLLKLKH